MEDRLDDLFVLDAEQAARELLVYGEGRSDLPIDRLAGTADYLAPLLQSCGLLRLAEACQLFQVLFEVCDEAQIRRSVREFAELSLKALESLKAGTSSSELGTDEALERLIIRLQQFSPNANQTSHHPSAPSRFRQFDAPHSDPDRELIVNAFRAIEAVDSLAVLIAQEAQGQHAGQTVPVLEDPGIDDEPTEQGSDDQALARHEASSEPEAQAAGASQVAAASDEPGAFEVEVPETPVEVPVEAQTQLATDPRPPMQVERAAVVPSYESAPRREVSSIHIDAAFRKALRLAHDGPWVQGMATLLESIDVLDHVDLRVALPPGLSLLGTNDVLVHAELARTLSQTLAQLQLSGVGDAMLVSQTLILAIQLDRLVPHERLANQLAWLGGRIEIDTSLRRWRIVVPASARLLRITQLKVDGKWVAVPWAQFLGLEGRPPRQEAQLCIGDESDRIRTEAMGLVCTGVRFELSKALRRRERYRGLVMLANAECLPVYA
jgi:hypothetical protein